eukprot:365447-Chlamydomonas_euryale.AAC.1
MQLPFGQPSASTPASTPMSTPACTLVPVSTAAAPPPQRHDMPPLPGPPAEPPPGPPPPLGPPSIVSRLHSWARTDARARATAATAATPGVPTPARARAAPPSGTCGTRSRPPQHPAATATRATPRSTKVPAAGPPQGHLESGRARRDATPPATARTHAGGNDEPARK